MNVRELKSCLRQGQYTWPGGYERLYITSDSEALCYDCVIENLREVFTAMRDQSNHSGWHIECVMTSETHDHTSDLLCGHCGRIILEKTEPDIDGGDITTTDYQHFYQSGRPYCTVTESDWQQQLKRYMEEDKYWPEVWFSNDHGNAHRLTLEDTND